MTKWKSEAGPRQTKGVDKALRALTWRGKARQEITDHGSHELVAMCSEPSEACTTALNEIGEKYGWLITRKNHKDVTADLTAATAALVLPVDDCRTTADERAEREAQRKRDDERRQVENSKHATEQAQHVAELREKYPWAVPAGEMSGHARASKNIKRELAQEFPGIKFRVRSDSFSMGNSVDVSWDLGPTSDEVSKITDKYQYGHFDGMQDMYESDHSAYGDAVEVVLGRSKYVQCHRSIPNEVHEQVGRALCEAQGVADMGSNTRGLFGSGDDEYLSTHVHRMFGWCSLPPGAVVTGVESTPDDVREASHYHTTPYRVTFTAPDPPKPKQSAPVAAGGSFTIEKHHHTKKGFDFYLCIPVERLSRDEFENERDRCKAAGGWYSRKWGTTPGGFAFKEETDAQAFAGCSESEAPTEPTAKPTKDDYAERTRARLHRMAEKLDLDADAKLAPRQTNTAKRLGQARSAERDGQTMRRAAGFVRAYADAENRPDGFNHTKARFLEIAGQKGRPVANGYHQYYVDSGEWNDTSPEACAVRALADAAKTDEEREAEEAEAKRIEIARMVDGVRGSQIRGFFPTPAPLARQMVEAAELEPAHRILEPSAGIGSICDEIATEVGTPANIDAVEVVPSLAEITSRKGYAVMIEDFLTIDNRTYDRVLMNPPFENGQDIDHVMHAEKLLKPGGRLVAIMSSGPFYGNDKKAQAFREWFDDVMGEVSDVEPGAFNGSDAFRKTGVLAKMVVIDSLAVA